MKILFIFDFYLDVQKINMLSLEFADLVYLFPLTSRDSIITGLINNIKTRGGNSEVIPTASIINSTADKLRQRYIQFIADITKQVRYKDKNLKELFAINNDISMWWFSLVAEKSTFKSDSFNRLVQLESIVHTIKKEKIILGFRGKKLKSALREYCHENNIKFIILPTNNISRIKTRFRESQKLFYLKHTMILVNFIIHELWRVRIIKRKISHLRRSIPQDVKSSLFFSYYPNIDKLSAQNAIFKDNFYIYLQETMEDNKQKIVWVVMYIPYNGITLHEALEYAKIFIKNGHIVFFLDEFCSFSLYIRTISAILKSSLKFLLLQRRIRKAHNFGDYNFYPIFKDDWYSSFVGETAYSGVMYYYIFREVFKKLKAKQCLYPCEMQPWEKALICARNALGIKILLYAYQLGTISRMLLNYFNHPDETSDDERYSLPKPDKVICNGKIPYAYMVECGWPKDKLFIAEALRYNHFKKYLNSPSIVNKQNIVLLAFSINAEESSSLLNITLEAFKEKGNWEVWLRPHPALRLDNVLKFAGISVRDLPFKIESGSLEDILLKSRVVIAGESSVSIEAIACGCQVVILNAPEWINMSPLKGIQTELVKNVSSPQSLRETVIEILQEEYNPQKYIEEARKITNNFFCINQKSDIPEIFLKLLVNN